jgi:hypothetical protein
VHYGLCSIDCLLTNFVVRPEDPLEDSEEELLRHKELIILFEAVRYCEINHVDRIRYTKLKQISNNTLSRLTQGNEVDFGGNFDLYIKKFEREYLHHIELVKRIKLKRHKTFIIPDIQKIAGLFEKVRLNNLFDEKASLNDALFIEYEDSYIPLHDWEGKPKEEGRIIDLIIPENVYIARYYYKNGHPVFLNPTMGDGKSLSFSAIDSGPFYIGTDYLHKKDSNKDSQFFKNPSILTSDPWCISSNGNIKVTEENVQLLLSLGKEIASKDSKRPFRITLEYKGDSPDN